MRPHLTVLIVDDEPGIRRSLGDALSEEGYTVLKAERGEQALELLQSPDSEALHLVFLDVWLPGMDGLETLRHMKEKAPKIPVILLTGHACMGVAVQGLDLGAYDYMLKPVAISELIIKMEEAARSAM